MFPQKAAKIAKKTLRKEQIRATLKQEWESMRAFITEKKRQMASFPKVGNKSP